LRRIKKKVHEKLTDANIKHVISLLEGSPKITKKEACNILNISYSTTRLDKIIQEYKEDTEYRAKRKAEKKGKPVERGEIIVIVESYLQGDSISDISKRIFRSPGFVKSLVERIGVPLRVSGEEKLHIELLPDECVSEEFEKGETAWAANYHAPCEIKDKLPEKYNNLYGTNCYKVWVRQKSEELNIDSGGFNAFIPAYDLGKLAHLKEFGVKIDKL